MKFLKKIHLSTVIFFRVATQVWRNKVLQVANEMKDVTFAIAKEDDFGGKIMSVVFCEIFENGKGVWL